MVAILEPYLRRTGMDAETPSKNTFCLVDILPTRRNILQEVERAIFSVDDKYVPFKVMNDTPECTEYLLTISPPSKYNELQAKLQQYFKSIGGVEIISTSFGNSRVTLLGMHHDAPKTGRDGHRYVPFTIKYHFELPK
ncbi:MAG: hypothetical protein HY365_00615 [Candidatus Aenigmarchaeota archaeon]|nr:hypothetical protein [Candidatus Aenigmarchaeota archaeon]